MTTEELEQLIGKKITGVGYEEYGEQGVFILLVKGKEFYFRSETPIEMDVEIEQ